jgi:signal peptidase I
MIVTFKSPPEIKKEYVKRVIGLPGDLIRIENQKIFINGKPFDDKFGKYRADYPQGVNGKITTAKYKERERFLIENGVYIRERYRWYKEGKTELFKESFFINDNLVKDEVYNFKLSKNEIVYDIDELSNRERTLISTNDLQISNFNFDEFTRMWIRDNFPLDIKDYELYGEFNARTDFSKYIVSKNGKNYFKVPDGYYFCMGDNRDHSWDSRFWGPVPEDYIIGKPWRIYWSYDANDYLKQGIGNKIKGLFDTVLNFFSKTRWERTGMLVK